MEVNSMPRRRIRRDKIPRATITIKLDSDLIVWLQRFENRSQIVENAVNRLKRTNERQNTDLLSFDEDAQGIPEAVRFAKRMRTWVSWYAERTQIRPKTTRFLLYELKRWGDAVNAFEESGESVE